MAGLAPSTVSFNKIGAEDGCEDEIHSSLALARNVPWEDAPGSDDYPMLVRFKYRIVRCQRCIANGLLTCLVLRGGHRTGKCFPCRSSRCSFYRTKNEEHREGVAVLSGAALASSSSMSSQRIASTVRKAMDYPNIS